MAPSNIEMPHPQARIRRKEEVWSGPEMKPACEMVESAEEDGQLTEVRVEGSLT
jgi:hypothetical protein